MNKRKTKDLDVRQRLPGLLVEDWQKVFDAMDIGITMSDKNGHFEIFNSKMQTITDHTLEQANASGDFSRLIYPDPLEHQKALARLGEIIQKPEYHEIETQIQAKDGTKKILSVSTSLINYKGQVMFLSVYQDVTQRRKDEQTLKQVKDELEIQAWGLQKANEGIKMLYRELETANEKLKEFDQLKSHFVGMVSHELNNPLSVLRESLALILDKVAGSISQEQKEILEIGKRSVDRLIRLVSNLLDLAKIEAGRMEIKRETIDILPFMNELLIPFLSQISKKQMTIQTNISPDIGVFWGDRDKMTEVFINLLNNAIKYTPEGGKIAIKLEGSEREIRFEIANTGPGIPEDQREMIFDKFTRITAEKQEGTGLGLSIVKEIVELHKGKIWVESEPGQGSRFIFTLPCVPRPTSSTQRGELLPVTAVNFFHLPRPTSSTS